ncbi:thioredoxin family protein [Portibacter marinus]|uniref:thioredoxin family protein n=1 Tax=Portibacter marinus TaxID=2898660 RepID=UPI001F3AA7A1|nr:thioredoxin family protein [Portibacter marinus]
MSNTRYKNTDPLSAIKKYSKAGNESLLLVFDAEWSSLSSMTEVIINKISSEKSNLNIVLADIEKHPEISKKYRIRRVPTCILLEDSEMKFRHEGMFSKKTILDKIARYSSN